MLIGKNITTSPNKDEKIIVKYPKTFFTESAKSKSVAIRTIGVKKVIIGFKKGKQKIKSKINGKPKINPYKLPIADK